jgi:hypothetical protein
MQFQISKLIVPLIVKGYKHISYFFGVATLFLHLSKWTYEGMRNIFEAIDEIKMGFIDIFVVAIYSPWVSNTCLKNLQIHNFLNVNKD